MTRTPSILAVVCCLLAPAVRTAPTRADDRTATVAPSFEGLGCRFDQIPDLPTVPSSPVIALAENQIGEDEEETSGEPEEAVTPLPLAYVQHDALLRPYRSRQLADPPPVSHGRTLSPVRRC